MCFPSGHIEGPVGDSLGKPVASASLRMVWIPFNAAAWFPSALSLQRPQGQLRQTQATGINGLEILRKLLGCSGEAGLVTTVRRCYLSVPYLKGYWLCRCCKHYPLVVRGREAGPTSRAES